MRKLFLAASTVTCLAYAAHAQKYTAHAENIKTRGANQLILNFPDATDDILWKVNTVEITLKNLSKFSKDTVLVFKYKAVREAMGYKSGGKEINTAPKEGKNLEIYLAGATLGEDYEKAVRKNVKPQYEANKSKLLIPKDPATLKSMISQVTVW